ncbi:MAG: ArsR/SmtB family transcription factor [Bacilli bacterium]
MSQQLITTFKALSDLNRLHILTRLQDGELCACTLLEEMTIRQSTLSHHMKILTESGLVKARKEGKWMYYSLDTKTCIETKFAVQQLLDTSGATNKACNCTEEAEESKCEL